MTLLMPVRRLLLALLLSLPYALTAAPSDQPVWSFGLSLQPTSDGQLFSFFLVRTKGDLILDTRPITREMFVKQAQGRATSLANADGKDLFAQYDIKACYLPPDSVAMGYSVRDCSVLDDLWKLRYWEYPQHVQGGPKAMTGWAAMPLRPSDRQFSILGGYGMKHLAGLIYGDGVFRLLKDMSDPGWVGNYRQG